MTLKIEVNDNKELSGTANGVYFVVYKDMLGNLTPSVTLALVEASDEIAALRAQLAEAVEALKPFAAESGMWGSKTPADEIPFIKGKDGKGDEAAFTVGDLRRAAEIVEKVTPA